MRPCFPSVRRYRLGLILLAVGLAGACGWAVFGRGVPVAAAKPASLVRVEVVVPRPGGIERICVQPGTVEPFQAADLYAKVSGFLAEQAVDIGSVVKAGDTLARISIPESEKQVKTDAAEVRRAEAHLDQLAAAIVSADADLLAAAANVALAEAEFKGKSSARAYHEKQQTRIRDLVSQKAVDAKLADEAENQFESAASAELAAAEAINSAKQRTAAARAKVQQARADRAFAETEVLVAKSHLEKSVVLLDYTIIRSPYNGVVTKRNFQPGDFVRSADSGGDRVPLLAVERTDLMRVVVHVPDRDVPYVNPGDPAKVTIDALPGEVFQTTAKQAVAVSRSAASEDPHTRTMRTEVDLPNPHGRLSRGMYGLVTLYLDPGTPAASRIPSKALVGKAESGAGTIRVVRGDTIHTVAIRCGADNGKEVEVLGGLLAGDRVVVRTGGTAADGANVAVVPAPAASAGH